MSTYARIQAGVVAEIGQFSQPIDELFHRSLQWIDVTGVAGVTVGWLYDGKVFSAPPPPDPTVLAARERLHRDRLLAASDWTQGTDSPLRASLQVNWRSYRQALRDVPQQPGFPASITWPVAPAAPATKPATPAAPVAAS